MSQSSSSTFQALFNAALQDYRDKTGNTLIDHPIARQLETCDSVNSITAILQEQARSFHEFRENDGKLVKALNSSVDVLCSPSISSALNEAIGLVPFPPAKAIFAGIGILLATVNEMRASYDALIDLFASFENFVSRLSIYAEIPPTPALTSVLVKIIVELISTLALATKQVKQGRFKKFLGKLRGEKDIETTIQRLDRLTLDEGRATAAQTLEVVYGLVQHRMAIMDDADGNESATSISRTLETMQEIVSKLNKAERDKLQQDVRYWLSPPDPWKNHNLARGSRHGGTGTWWIEGDGYAEWKSSGASSLLWVHGKPGAGKSVICSAIIEDNRTFQKSGLISLAFFYCDFRDDQKKDRRGLLSSLLVQLGEQSDAYSAILSKFFEAHCRGQSHASDSELADCLKDMLKLLGQAKVYIVIDALDECPVTAGSQFPREEVLEIIEDLVNLQLPSLRICVTSRPEADILPILEPLAFRSISLHSEDGQVHDIAEYVKSFVHNDREMRRWKATDKQLVIEVLTEKADGMFRWVFCQLVYLRRCIPARIRRALNELPETLDETYARALKEIDKPNWEYAHRLFQCVAAASRPFHVEELAEFLAFDFEAGATPTFLVDWRPEDPTHTVLSTCSSLLAVVSDESTPDYMISSPPLTPQTVYRTPTPRSPPESPVIPSPSRDGGTPFIPPDQVSQPPIPTDDEIYIPLEPTIPMDDVMYPPLPQAGIESRPPGLAAQFAHFSVKEYLTSARLAKEKDPISRFHVSMTAAHTIIAQACLGVLLHIDENITEDGLKDFPLAEYAARHWVGHARFENVASNVLDGMKRLFDPSKNHFSIWIWICDPEYPWHFPGRSEHPVAARATSLHYAAFCGMHDIARFLAVEHPQDVIARGFRYEGTPLHVAVRRDHVEVARVLLEHGADTEVQDGDGYTPLLWASRYGSVEIARVLLEHGAGTAGDEKGFSPLGCGSRMGRIEVVQVLLEYGADANMHTEERRTPLHSASGYGELAVVRALLEHGADVKAQEGDKNMTPLHEAEGEEVARLLLEHGADANALDIKNRTPLHRSSEVGSVAAARVLLELGVDVNAQDANNATPLHLASDSDSIYRTEECLDVARLLLQYGSDIHARDDKGQTPFMRATVQNRHDMMQLLLEHGAEDHRV